jgi:hypothetical protein
MCFQSDSWNRKSAILTGSNVACIAITGILSFSMTA